MSAAVEAGRDYDREIAIVARQLVNAVTDKGDRFAMESAIGVLTQLVMDEAHGIKRDPAHPIEKQAAYGMLSALIDEGPVILNGGASPDAYFAHAEKMALATLPDWAEFRAANEKHQERKAKRIEDEFMRKPMAVVHAKDLPPIMTAKRGEPVTIPVGTKVAVCVHFESSHDVGRWGVIGMFGRGDAVHAFAVACPRCQKKMRRQRKCAMREAVTTCEYTMTEDAARPAL